MSKKPAPQSGAKLERRLSPMNVWALAFGCIIGWGSFVNPGKKFLATSGTLGTAIAMAGGALVMIIIAFSYSYMVPKYPKAGGEFTFTKICFGKVPAFICGWFLVAAYLTNVPMNSTALGLIVKGIFGDFLQFGYLYTLADNPIYVGEILFACAILILFAVFCVCGVKVAGVIQTILAATLAICVFTLAVSALLSSETSWENLIPYFGFDKTTVEPKTDNQSIISGVVATFAIAPWAFVGFDTIPQAAEEFNFPAKKVNFIMIIAVLFGGFVYISNNLVTASVYANYPEEITRINAEGGWALLESARILLGNFGVVLVGAGVLSAVLTGMMGFYMASSRLMYSMSKEGYLPKAFSKISPKFKTPYVALIFCLVVSLVGPFLGREALGWWLEMSNIGAAVGFGFTALATIVTLKKNNEKKPFTFVMAILGTLFSLIFIILMLVPLPFLPGVNFVTPSYIMLVVWVVLGVLFFAFKNKDIKAAEKE